MKKSKVRSLSHKNNITAQLCQQSYTSFLEDISYATVHIMLIKKFSKLCHNLDQSSETVKYIQYFTVLYTSKCNYKNKQKKFNNL